MAAMDGGDDDDDSDDEEDDDSCDAPAPAPTLVSCCDICAIAEIGSKGVSFSFSFIFLQKKESMLSLFTPFSNSSEARSSDNAFNGGGLLPS